VSGNAPAESSREGAAQAIGERWNEAVRAHERGDLERAREGYDWVLSREPDFAPARFLSGMLARDAGDLARAVAELDRALLIAPQLTQARVARARMALNAGELDAASAIARAGLSFGADAGLWEVIGLAELRRGDANAALAAFEFALSVRPEALVLRFNRGVALQALHDVAGAELVYRQILEIDPGFVDARYNLGALLQERGSIDAAVDAYRAVLAIAPSHVAANKNLGEALLTLSQIDAFIAHARSFEAACPASLAMAVQRLEACQYDGDHAGVDRVLDGLRRLAYRAGDDAELVDSLETLQYLLLFFDVEPAFMLALARRYDEAARRHYGEPLPQSVARRSGRLRVGYVSADLRDHVMGKMVFAAVEHHDKSRFELYFYSLSQQEDAWTARFRTLAHHFASLAGFDEHAAALRIADDDLDLLVDLSTHTKGAKPGIFAHKPGRVAVTHVASAGTLGLSSVDFKLTDRHADVESSAAFQLEAPLVMEGCVYPWREFPMVSSHPFTRDSLGVQADTVLIGAFVNPLKLSRRCLAVWRDVLAAIPGAKLAFSPVATAWRDSYLRLTGAAGIDASRIVFMPQGRDEAEGQARYSIVDFVLDPFPFGGVNGVLEPLAAGVPVVALVGRRHGERSAYSILTNLGVSQTLATTAGDYVAIARRLAFDRGFAAEVRAALVAGIASSPLTDRLAHTRALERAYVAALAAKAPEALRSASDEERP
jgi:predicted O-linked N-acetylglucosamine transferase (SPINDLY family)